MWRIKKRVFVFFLTLILISNVGPVFSLSGESENISITNNGDTAIKSNDANTGKKQVINLNEGWMYVDGTDQTQVNLPHCWEYVHPTMSYIPTMNSKTTYYEKKLDVTTYKGKNLFLKFYGVNKNADIYINDTKAGSHIGGFTAFVIDITDFATTDVITIKVVTTNIDIKSMPINTDFTHFAGIYRDVELIACDDTYISVEDYGASGVYVDQKIANDKADLAVKVKMSNKSSENESLQIKTELFDDQGNLVADDKDDVNILADQLNQQFSLNMTLASPHLWNGTKDPYLYTLKTTVYKENEVIDTNQQKIGLRTFEVKNGTFYLNGLEYELHGVGFHQDREGYGNATTDEMKKEDMDLMKEMGVNAIRTAHYPHDDYIYQLADEYGFVVWNEIPFYMIMADTDTFRNTTKQQAIEMVRQGYNHPSIICWGIQNEVNTNASYAVYGKEFAVSSSTLAAFMTELGKLVKQEDTSRMVVQAHIDSESAAKESSAWTKKGVIDSTGLNLYYGFKSPIKSGDENGYKQIQSEYSTAINKYKTIFNTDSLAISEYGAGGNTDQHTTIDSQFSWSGNDNSEPEHPEELQSFVHEAAYDQISKQEDVWVAFVWNMFDFSCYRNQGGKERLNNKGLITYDHKTKKDAFYFYKANWNKDDKFVYITQRRQNEVYTQYNTVKVYSNCDNVKLIVNNKDYGNGQKQQEGVFVWKNVEYSESNDIKAIGNSDNCEYTDEIQDIHLETSVNYQTHVQDLGWQSTVKDGQTAGTTGQAKRLEAIKIDLNNSNGSIEYRTHIQDIGWESGWKKDGELSGTEGQAKRLEAIQIQLTGKLAEEYDIYYRVHAENLDWMDWAKNGESAGTAGYAYRLEAIEIRLVKKGESAPGKTDKPYVQHYIGYSTHIQDIDWQGMVYDGAMSGTEGQSKRLEAIRISLQNAQYEGDVEYRTHVQDYGWESSWKKNGNTSGTSGQSKRLEAIQIRLTREMAEKYDIYYRVHTQDFGWLGWAKNGESAGTEGYAKRLEGIEIKLVKKGDPAPGVTENSFYRYNSSVSQLKQAKECSQLLIVSVTNGSYATVSMHTKG